MPVSATVSAGIVANHTGAHDLGTPFVKVETSRRAFEFANGVTAGKADRVFGDRRQLAASANETLDLAGGLTDAFGASLTFAKVVAIAFKAADTNAGDIIVGGAATHTIAVKPGGALTLVAPKGGWTVTPATDDLLKVANAVASAAEYEVVILGTSA